MNLLNLYRDSVDGILAFSSLALFRLSNSTHSAAWSVGAMDGQLAPSLIDSMPTISEYLKIGGQIYEDMVVRPWMFQIIMQRLALTMEIFSDFDTT